MKTNNANKNDFTIIFSDNSSFLSRYLGSLWVPLIIPIMIIFIGYLSEKSVTSGRGLIIILGITIYIFFISFKRNIYFISEIKYSLDERLIYLDFKKCFRRIETISAPVHDFEIKKVQISIYRNFKLVICMTGGIVIEQSHVGKWTPTRMDQVIKEIESLKRTTMEC